MEISDTIFVAKLWSAKLWSLFGGIGLGKRSVHHNRFSEITLELHEQKLRISAFTAFSCTRSIKHTDLRLMTAHAVPMKCSGMIWKLPRTAHWSHSKTELMLPRLRESMQVDVIKLICSKSARFQVQSESFQVNVNASNSLKRLPSECDCIQIPNERMGLMRGFKPEFYLHCATSHRALVSLLAHVVLQTHGSIFQALTTSLPRSLFLFAFSFPPVLSTQEQASPPPSPLKFQLL